MNKIIAYFKSPSFITGKPKWTTSLFVMVVIAIAIEWYFVFNIPAHSNLAPPTSNVSGTVVPGSEENE